MYLQIIILLTLLGIISACEVARDDFSETVVPVKDPIVVALRHFQALPEIWLWVPKKHAEKHANKKIIVVDNVYDSTKGYLGKGQISSDLSGEGWSVPSDARDDMERRVDQKEILNTIGWPSFLRVANLEDESKDENYEFVESFPDARCFVTLWPPGFTSDSSKVVLRFWFGPTPHGAIATYLLEIKDGIWHVKHFHVIYYA